MTAPDSVFDTAAAALEANCDLDRLAARGTLRLLLKDAGFDPKAILRDELVKVLEALLPDALGSRGIGDADAVLAAVLGAVRSSEDVGVDAERPERIFARLGS